ncbi:hypothetical protein WICPIJ_004827 [Wickerhamomyces pijperi]|uniref:non-specific serine/threonine protein kinase n=1 Tax=Wickerhamomyces pijperi TaxID=599730 RepID=A0A9P8TMI1_WICPI|nr:hypothetical protein WICPIJ_004827 [Wickerhamomyces pijperi]
MPYSAPDGVTRIHLANKLSPSTTKNADERDHNQGNQIQKLGAQGLTCSMKLDTNKEATPNHSSTDENIKSGSLHPHKKALNSKFLLFQDEEYDEGAGLSDSYNTQERPSRSPISKLTVQTNNASTPKSKPAASGPPSSRIIPESFSGISKISTGLAEIMKFPKESTHAYSYAYLSPNSLAVRLSILKRSLEILIDHPELMSEQSSLDFDIETFINNFRNEDTLPKHGQSRPKLSTSRSNKHFGYSNNASSAALSALFDTGGASGSSSLRGLNQSIESSDVSKADRLNTDELKVLLRIIGMASTAPEEDQSKELDGSSSNSKDLATNLFELSLTSTQLDKKDEELQLKIKLLHALATPFYEPIAAAPLLSFNHTSASSLALSSLSSPSSQVASPVQHSPDRFFHNVPQKNTSPQAVFTCTYTDPWDLKAANDLACLIFGVSRMSLKRLTLLDLVAPDSRDFVLNKLVSNSINYTSHSNDMVFSGEIIAISKPGNKLTWASLWAKRKGNLIICMFDQVPCDSVDVTISLSDFKILATKQISDSSGIFSDVEKLEAITDLVKGIDGLVSSKREFNRNVPPAIWDSQVLNQQRYFTIRGPQETEFGIPCAVASKVIDEIDSKVKLRIHSLPYIAGVFLISTHDFSVLSMNESVSKNLFGLKEPELTGKSVCRIIPRFSEIMDLIKKRFSNLPIRQGLVLPEHFFRQMNALLTEGDESKFVESIGIDGKHADGSTIKIDVQLRCSNNESLILWVTHSRSVYLKDRKRVKKSEEIQLNSNEDNSRSRSNSNNDLNSDSKSNASHSNQSSSTDLFDQNMPSQLTMLKEENVTSLSRLSSLKVNSGTSTEGSQPTSGTNTVQEQTNQEAAPANANNGNGTEVTDKESATDIDEFNFKALDLTFNEAELLRIENETIERNRSFSRAYPTTIGLKRREKSFKEFRVIKKMGQGAYGRVVLCENIEDPNYRVVIKLIIKERILVDTWVRDRKLGTIPSEIQIMATLNSNPHPNIMRLIDFFEDEQYYYIETPPHGNPVPAIDLYDLIELKKNMTEYECQSIIKQCVNALNHLHKSGVVHRDIKDENLIIDVNGVIKLIDFGSAAYTKQGPFDVFVGTLDYAAPEVLNGAPYEGKPQDIWSLGILIYTLIYKETPFYNVDEIMEGELRLPFVFCDGCTNLIKSILIRDVKKRPTIDDIMKDEWLNRI